MSTVHFESRLRALLVFLTACFGSLGLRLFYLQVLQGEDLRIQAEANRTSLVLERAPRGLILDRNGWVLSDSKPTFVVLFTGLELRPNVFDGVVRRLARILNLGEDDLRKRLQPALKHSSMVRVMDRASRWTAFALAEQRPNLPGVSVVIEMQRRYPNGPLASHLLGYIGQVSSEEFQALRQEGYRQDWLVGKMGLEKVYDSYLRGEHGGMRIEVDASGRSLKVLDRKDPVAGYQIKTTIQWRVQQEAEKALEETGKAGAAVAMDPRNGEILAFASSPSFDPNLFVYTRGENPGSDFNPLSLLNSPDLPLYDRPIQGLYAPGSVFKIVDTAAAIETGRLSPQESFYCPGYFWLGGPGGKKFLCWKKEGHGRMDLEHGLINSCNVFFYHAGLKVGPDAIEAMARRFGLGARTGIELPGEKEGLIPGRSMFKTSRRRWFDGDTLNMAIGQGTVLLTPLQAARLAAAVGSHGRIYRPILVREINSPTGEPVARAKPELVGEVKLSPATWEFLDQALTQVVDQGTGQSGKIEGIPVAGKTGTAQNPHGKDHAWFVAYAPVGNPTIAVSVLVEHGVKGSVAAAPIARRILLAALRPDQAAEPQKAKAVSGD